MNKLKGKAGKDNVSKINREDTQREYSIDEMVIAYKCHDSGADIHGLYAEKGKVIRVHGDKVTVQFDDHDPIASNSAVTLDIPQMKVFHWDPQ